MINLISYFEGGAHKFITRSIIRKIASNPKHRSMTSCLKLMQGGYTDSLVEDLEQEIAAALIELNSRGLITEFVTLFQHRMCFGDIVTDQEGEDGFPIIESSYLELYRAFYKGLAKFSQHDTNKGLLPASDLMYTDDNGKDHAITLRASNYIGLASQQADIEGLFARSDIMEFMEFLRYTEKPQKVDDICNIIEGLSEGKSRAEISAVYNLSIKRIDYLIKSMRDSWNSHEYKVYLIRRKSFKYGGAVCGTITNYSGGTETRRCGDIKIEFKRGGAVKEVNRAYIPYSDRFTDIPLYTTDYSRDARRGGCHAYDTAEIDKRLAQKGLYKVDGQWRTYKSGYDWREKHTLKRGATKELLKALIQAI